MQDGTKPTNNSLGSDPDGDIQGGRAAAAADSSTPSSDPNSMVIIQRLQDENQRLRDFIGSLQRNRPDSDSDSETEQGGGHCTATSNARFWPFSNILGAPVVVGAAAAMGGGGGGGGSETSERTPPRSTSAICSGAAAAPPATGGASTTINFSYRFSRNVTPHGQYVDVHCFRSDLFECQSIRGAIGRLYPKSQIEALLGVLNEQAPGLVSGSKGTISNIEEGLRYRIRTSCDAVLPKSTHDDFVEVSGLPQDLIPHSLDDDARVTRPVAWRRWYYVSQSTWAGTQICFVLFDTKFEDGIISNPFNVNDVGLNNVRDEFHPVHAIELMLIGSPVLFCYKMYFSNCLRGIPWRRIQTSVARREAEAGEQPDEGAGRSSSTRCSLQ